MFSLQDWVDASLAIKILKNNIKQTWIFHKILNVFPKQDKAKREKEIGNGIMLPFYER